jgi:hypothetical protein
VTEEGPRFIGERLDALDVRATLPDEVLISSALVLLEVLWPDGQTSLIQAHSPGTNWIKRVGILTVAQAVENSEYRPHTTTEDDQ